MRHLIVFRSRWLGGCVICFLHGIGDRIQQVVDRFLADIAIQPGLEVFRVLERIEMSEGIGKCLGLNRFIICFISDIGSDGLLHAGMIEFHQGSN